MADLPTLTTRLLIRLPGRSSTELEGWITEAATQHDYATVADVPDKAVNAILAYAEYLGLKAKAAETAENAALNIKGIGVNKSGASGNYNALIKEALAQYRRDARKAGIRPLTGGSVTSGTVTRPDGR
ncbi:MAG TPA: hypothetical protein DEF34_03370 [Desulfotomaculum sp.]|nr:MAG: hypothetical protein JL56_02980 [Desulfotomaculum sp. BICA1-6]HBX22668.1 hypothetical protein [Desulfotomaculum sp.]